MECRGLDFCCFRFSDDDPVEELDILGKGISTLSKGLGGNALNWTFDEGL